MDFQIFSDIPKIFGPIQIQIQHCPAPWHAVADLGPLPGASDVAEAAGADSEEAPGARPLEAWLGAADPSQGWDVRMGTQLVGHTLW